MGLLTEAATERTIDHTFDQTAPHVHGNKADCPTCTAVENYHTPTRLFSGGNEIDLDCDHDFEKENRNLRELYEQACRDRDDAQIKVKSFERFTDVLANHLDALLQISNPAQAKAEFPKAA